MCGLLAPCYVTKAKMKMMHTPKDVTRIEACADMVLHATQVGMMHTPRCSWEVSAFICPQRCDSVWLACMLFRLAAGQGSSEAVDVQDYHRLYDSCEAAQGLRRAAGAVLLSFQPAEVAFIDKS